MFFYDWQVSNVVKQKRIADKELDAEPEAAPAPKVTYTLSIFSVAELNKPPARREPEGRFFVSARVDMPWIDFYVQLKIQFCNALFPQQAIVADHVFKTTYSISRLVPNALPLDSAADYAHLITNMSKMKNNPAVKITIKEIQKPNQNERVRIHILIFSAFLLWLIYW